VQVSKLWLRALLWCNNLHRRLLTALFAIIGPRSAYWITRWGARTLYSLVDVLRERSEVQCRAALAGRVPEEDVPHIARQSFVSRAWNLTDLMLATRRLRAGTYCELGGRIEEPYLDRLLAAQRTGKPAILVTAYYGPYDLLPAFLGYNGVRATIVYLPHRNAGYDRFRQRIRGQSGCQSISVSEAGPRIGQLLGQGQTVALVADHFVQHRGMPVTFLGLKTKALRSVGLLAWRYGADVVVAGIRRIDERFHFKIVVADVVEREEIAAHADAVAMVTDRYLRALEQLILGDPTQYMWAYARWGEEFAVQHTAVSGRTDSGE